MRYLIVAVMATGLTTPAHFNASANNIVWNGENLHADTSCGIIWDEPILLSDTNYNAYSPKIALSGADTVHVTWLSEARIGQPDLRLPYARSAYGGSNFEPARELLIDSLQHPYNAVTPHTVAEGQNVYIFFTGSAGLPSRVHMIKSSNGGSAWGPVYGISPDSASSIQSVGIQGDTISIIYPPPPSARKILRSTDGGQTWTRTNDTLNYFARVALSPGVLHLVQHTPGVPPEIEYRRSADLGTTWNHTSILSEIDPYWSDIPTIASGDDSLVLVAWRDAKYGCLSFGGCSIIARTGVTGSDSTAWTPETVVTDTPRGFNAAVAVNSRRKAVSWVDEVVSNTIFHAAVRVSAIDNGWCPVVDLTPTTEFTVASVDVALSKKAVHVVWHQNVAPDPSTFRIFYRRGRFMTTDVREEEPGVPVSAMLQQNYPNPFNPSTTIRFTLTPARPMAGWPSLSRGERVDVRLRVYDMLGREVATLVNEKKEPGEHTVEWNAENMPSGVYYYRLIAGDRIETRKAILLK